MPNDPLDSYDLAILEVLEAEGRISATELAARIGLSNLVLAGDWTATGLPATIEGAIRSGRTAVQQLRTT